MQLPLTTIDKLTSELQLDTVSFVNGAVVQKPEDRADAERMLLATRSALDADGHIISTGERANIETLMAQLRTVAADSQDAAAIEAATDALAKGTEAFAAERMNHSIHNALAGKNVEAI